MYWFATGIFILAYALIISEKIHKTKVALFGAAITLIGKILDQNEAFHNLELGVDWNVVFLLISMMVMINIMTKTGVFQYVAIKCAKIAKGEPFRIMTLFAVITAMGSAFLDNVTTVLLLAPVTLLIAEQLEINPIPYLITEALASNIGGTATLIGDPPNIMIASKAGLNFMDFIVHLTPAIIIIFLFWMLAWKIVFGKSLTVKEELKRRIMTMNEREQIRDPALLKKSLLILGLTILGFMLHGFFHYEPATVALMGAATLFMLSDEEPTEILAEVEWPTIFFFIGLFIIIGGIVKVGLVEDLSRAMIAVTHPKPDDMAVLAMVMLWFSAVSSAIVDNIPFVATMNPILIDLSNQVFGSAPTTVAHARTIDPVWWALALGACLGGNGSPIGASANVIVIGLSEKAGYRISFGQFLKYGIPTTFLTIFLAMIYLYLRYYVLQWF
ncbi:SLC13 family permease [Desulfuromonas acetoxidans]|uniref:Citrate transporter n=1 Tax=Desulfuromonas acetoxidans (strain DSM 684 / 11070) TaxID=281689 RepID=Q1K116_DESA6|nr:ArsB/NhaD family transporter [Desulfuromonas acetoxidans]EAT16192.1 Citrate transporter [Desulfuromonas acetoxidans DSM 684]MBF0645234.1 ArsB/NhaD family transporter [Desulfuromonas acetoxidans]NVD23022.1 ArsB/NhaD family transporter [Desulfuromonas acetoxidans]NVE15737.1 ArsB/NhaD family transporter [Desulfuromonas acetoxidans]